MLAEKNHDNVRKFWERISDGGKEELKRQDKVRMKEARVSKIL